MAYAWVAHLWRQNTIQKGIYKLLETLFIGSYDNQMKFIK